MSPRKKGAILSFAQSGNFELSPQAGFEPGTLHVTVGPLIHYLYQMKIFKPNVKRFLQFFCGRVTSRLEQQSAISFEKTINKKRLYLFTQTEFFHETFRNLQEGTQSRTFIIILPIGKLFGKKVNYTQYVVRQIHVFARHCILQRTFKN